MSFNGLLDESCEIARKSAGARPTGVSAPSYQTIALGVPCSLQMQIPVLNVSLEEFQRVSVSIWLGMFLPDVDLRSGDHVTRIGPRGLPRPANLQAVLGPLAGGGVWASAGNRGWRISALGSKGETVGSVEAALNVTAVSRQVTLTWDPVPLARRGYRLYRTEVPGGYGDTTLRAVIVDPATVEFVDDGSATIAGRLPFDKVFELQELNLIRNHHAEATLRLRSTL